MSEQTSFIIEASTDAQTLWVDPRRIQLATLGLNSRRRPPEVLEALRASEGFVLDGDWDDGAWKTGLKPIESLDVYAALRDCLLGDQAWEDTRFFKRVMRSIDSGTPKWGCHNEAQLRERLDVHLRGLFEDIATNGFRTQEELGSSTPVDEVRVGIRRDGRFIMFDGRHRLIIARLLGIQQIPVRVVVRHRAWVDFKQEIRDYTQEALRGKVYQQLDHPDLQDIPAKHGTERIEILKKGLEGYEPVGRRLLDVGTHWGYMAQQMERLGFVVTGIELNPAAAAFARRLRVATESEYEIWEGNLLEFPERRFDVVLALSIFHHMIKTEARHTQLAALLARLQPEMMFFEPHDPELSADQMKDAYRNYAPDAFVKFVSENAGLPRVEYLGTPDDNYRRPIYKLTR